MSKERYEWIFENGENEIIDNMTGQYVTISSPELLNEKDQKISDLEAKLAESEKEIKVIDEDRQFKAEMWTRFADKCKDLKQQLADKEKEIERIREVNLDIPIKQMQFHHNQDKISFALEQLEKARSNILCNEKFYFENLNKYIEEQIENQIEELKKEMK